MSADLIEILSFVAPCVATFALGFLVSSSRPDSVEKTQVQMREPVYHTPYVVESPVTTGLLLTAVILMAVQEDRRRRGQLAALRRSGHKTTDVEKAPATDKPEEGGAA